MPPKVGSIAAITSHSLSRSLLVELDVEDVDAGELLEQHRLAFHHRLGRQRADVAQAQHGGAVGDHAHQVAAGGVAEGIRRVGHDLFAGRGHAGAVGQRQVALVDHLLGGGDLQLARRRELVVLQRGAAQFGGLVACLPGRWARGGQGRWPGGLGLAAHRAVSCAAIAPRAADRGANCRQRSVRGAASRRCAKLRMPGGGGAAILAASDAPPRDPPF
jgi:hypothetical protein